MFISGTLVLALMEIINIGSLAPFLAIASDPTLIETNEYLHWMFEFLGSETTAAFTLQLGVIILIALIARNIIGMLYNHFLIKFNLHCQHVLSIKLLRTYLHQSPLFFLTQNSAKLSHIVLNEIKALFERYFIPIIQLIGKTMIVLSIIALLVATQPVVAITMGGIVGGSYVLFFLLSRRRMARMGKRQFQNDILKHRTVTEAMGGIKEIKLSGREPYFVSRYESVSDRSRVSRMHIETTKSWPSYMQEIVMVGGILSISLVILATNESLISVLPLLGLYAFAGLRLKPAINRMFQIFVSTRSSRHRVKSCLEHFELERRMVAGGSDGKPTSFTQSIELQDVSFAYPNTNNLFVNRQSLRIDANTTVGFVGITGSGKTTMVNIILGLLPVQQGRLLIDSVSIDTMNLRNWQSNVGYVPQQIYLYDDTVLRNIAFGIDDKQIDYERVRECARISHLQDFIENETADGYDTIIGERGTKLSGGQMQRIGIARALYHNPKLLVFDEATSALDTITEKIVMEALHDLGHRKTIVIVAHRISTVKECDVIYVFEKGAVVASGSYDELVRTSSLFRSLANL